MIRHQRRYLSEHQVIAFQLNADDRRRLERFLSESDEDLESFVMGVVNGEIDLVEESFRKGREKGKEEGYVAGYHKGSEDGHRSGYEKGYKKGHKKGARVGEDKGYRSGYGKGKEEGRVYYHCGRCGADLLIEPDSDLLDEIRSFLNRKKWKHISTGECKKRKGHSL